MTSVATYPRPPRTVIEHGGVLLAPCEGGLPYAVTAHPTTDPDTGELFFFGYAATAPYLTFHVADATGDTAGRIVVDAVSYAPNAFVGAWTGMGPASGTVTETPLDDRSVEFPSLNGAHMGGPSRYRYAVAADRLVKYDLDLDTAVELDPGVPGVVGEACFVPAADATDPAAGPVGTDTLPRRVPAGFHGSWVAA